ncbi:unnamed protein product, partial [Ascophyllum nodosum]
MTKTCHNIHSFPPDYRDRSRAIWGGGGRVLTLLFQQENASRKRTPMSTRRTPLAGTAKNNDLTYSRWASSLPSCLWSQRIFPSLPGSRLTNFYRDASSALLQL